MVEFQAPNWTYRAAIDRVVDADTVDVWLDMGFKQRQFKRIRLYGIDAWETRGEERVKGLAAKQRVEALVKSAGAVYVQTLMDAEGKYGRLLGYLWVAPEGVQQPVLVNALLVDEGHATLYE